MTHTIFAMPAVAGGSPLDFYIVHVQLFSAILESLFTLYAGYLCWIGALNGMCCAGNLFRELSFVKKGCWGVDR